MTDGSKTRVHAIDQGAHVVPSMLTGLHLSTFIYVTDALINLDCLHDTTNTFSIVDNAENAYNKDELEMSKYEIESITILKQRYAGGVPETFVSGYLEFTAPVVCKKSLYCFSPFTIENKLDSNTLLTSPTYAICPPSME